MFAATIMRPPCPNLSYLRHLLLHKWYVLVAGLRLGVPLLQLVLHDLSKFSAAEWPHYVRRHAGVDDPEGFASAWHHHQKANPHHWEHWVLIQDRAITRPLPMSDHFILEMAADWHGEYLLEGGQSPLEWYRSNRLRFVMHEETRVRFEEILEWIG